jgi:hypothetical protein
MTAGTYQRELSSQTAITWTGGTETEVTALANSIVANVADQDEMWSWIRFQFYVGHSSAFMYYEYMVIKCLATDATQDLNSSSVVESLHKQSRIFARGLMYSCSSAGASKPIKLELYNVKLEYGEELRLLIRPLHDVVGATGMVYGLLEFRRVGT